MDILLNSFDSKMPNLALMKLGRYHQKRGDNIRLAYGKVPIWGDRQYISVMFAWSKGLLPDWGIKGGPGFDPKVELPPAVEKLRPFYGLYPENKISWGYTFRGCPRGCSFCLVPKMPMGSDFSHRSIWSFATKRKKEICLLNNNTFFDLQWPDTFREIYEANLTIMDLNGYDIRLMDRRKAEWLARLKWSKGVHFAYDNISSKDKVIAGLKCLEKHGTLHGVRFYCLTGYDETFEQELERINLLRSFGVSVFALQYRQGDPARMRLKSWTYNTKAFFKVEFKDYLNYTERKKRDETPGSKLNDEIFKVGRRRGRRSGTVTPA